MAKRVTIEHIRKLHRRYPELLSREATRASFTALAADISLVSDTQLRAHGPIDLVIAGWPCQGLSMAGNQNGLHDKRSALFQELVRILHTLQVVQVNGPGYIIENVPVMSESRERNLTSVKKIEAILGPSVFIDAAKVGSRAHRARMWWTNLVPTSILRAAYDHLERPKDLLVQDILDPQRTPRHVRWDDKPPYAVVNKANEPRRAWPTFVSFPKSYAFRGDGPGTVLDTSGGEYTTQEPNADERERAMGFLTGTTSLADQSISESQRRMLLGQAMDLNCLTWMLAIATVEQQRMAAMASIVPSYDDFRAIIQSLPQPETGGKVAGGGLQQPIHPWQNWGTSNFYKEAHHGGMVESHETLEALAEHLFFSKEDDSLDWEEYMFIQKNLTSMAGIEGEEDPGPRGIA